jgi:hypothetical protein
MIIHIRLPLNGLLRLGFQRIEDSYHPPRYRELGSPAEMRKLLNEKTAEQGGECAICHAEFVDCTDIAADHRCPNIVERAATILLVDQPVRHRQGLKQPLAKVSRRRMELLLERKKEIPDEGL